MTEVAETGLIRPQVVTKALQLHPRESSLWAYAAAWEFEHNRNAGAARALMQRGLRMCPGDAGLWAEYFRLELLYAHTLRARRKVLGIEGAADGASRPVSCVCMGSGPRACDWLDHHLQRGVHRLPIPQHMIHALVQRGQGAKHDMFSQ